MTKNLISGYKKGSNLTILDAVYHRSEKDEETGKWSKDSMTLIYIDNETTEKKSYTFYEPEYEYYIREEDPGYHMFFESKNNLTPVKVKYKDLKYDISKRLGYSTGEYRTFIDRTESEKLLSNNRIFGADIAINNYYRMKFAREYQNPIINIKRSFLDIETDIKNMKGNFPEPGECPINAISYLEYDSKELLTVLYDDGSNPLIKDFTDKYSTPGKYQHEFGLLLNNVLGGEKRVNKFGLDKLKVKFVIYTDEAKMLYELFGFINKRKPDFLLVWNMAFDMPYIIERIKKLGFDPKEFICDSSFPESQRHCEYNVDKNHIDPERKTDYADISSMIVYLDQLIQFASRRKGQSVFSNNKLDYIGEKIAGVHKLDYSDITLDIGELPYKDYTRFVMYNMIDVIVQYCIENKTDDANYVFNKAIQNCTEYRKVHRQTIYLANRAIMRFYDYGEYICGNNVNKFKPKPMDKYEGAFVSDPLLISDKIKTKINGKPINLVANPIDFDFSKLYPSITQQNNLAPNTQIGKVIIPNRVYANENSIHNPHFTRSGAFMGDFLSDNYIEFAHRWFQLGNFEEVYKDIVEYFTTIEIPFDTNFQDYIYKRNWTVVRQYDKDHPVNVIQFIDENRNMCEVEPLPARIKEKLTTAFWRDPLNETIEITNTNVNQNGGI